MTRPAPIVRTLLADAPLNEGVLISIIQEARNVDAEDIRIANAILPDAGTYLNRFAIQLFIRAEMTDEEARREIARQKAFFKRLRLLLPALAGYFSFENDQDALSFLMNVSDVHQDFYAIAREKREDRNRRETLASFVTARKAVEKAIVALRSANSAAVYDYGHAYSGFVSLHQLKDRKTYPHDEPFNQLVAEMELFVNSLELTHFRAKTEDRHVYIPNNQTRTHVVENAYGFVVFGEGLHSSRRPVLTSRWYAACSLRLPAEQPMKASPARLVGMRAARIGRKQMNMRVSMRAKAHLSIGIASFMETTLMPRRRVRRRRLKDTVSTRECWQCRNSVKARSQSYAC